jgi:diguanylate cyclase (GGDEF)-like protein
MPNSTLSRTQIGRRQKWFARSLMAALVATGAVTAPLADTPLLALPSLYMMFLAAMFVINLILSSLLFIKGAIEHDGDAIRMGAAYCFAAAITVPMALGFPGGVTPIPLIGGVETGLWLWVFLHAGFGLAILRFAWSSGRGRTTAYSPLLSVAWALGAAAGATWIATRGLPFLPPLLSHSRFVTSWPVVLVPAAPALVTAAALFCVVRRHDHTPQHLWLVVGLVASCLEVFLALIGSARFALGWYVAKAAFLASSATVLISLLHDITWLFAQAAIDNAALRKLARADGLTGIGNRRYFDELLTLEFRRAQRQELPLAVIMLDVDFFKGFNDRYGHPAGDDCLRRVARAVQGALMRPGDAAARYGGEEIVVVLPTTEADGAMLIADRIQEAVAALSIEHAGSLFGVVTVSAGVGVMIPLSGSDTAADLVAMADRALYRSKHEGRNRVSLETKPGASEVAHSLRQAVPEAWNA